MPIVFSRGLIMRNIFIGGIVLLALGLSYAGQTMRDKASQPDIVSGKVTSIYGSEIIAIDGYNGHIMLSGFDSENAALLSDDDRRQNLKKMINGQPVTCRPQNYDEYGRMVAECENADGLSLQALDKVAIQ